MKLLKDRYRHYKGKEYEVLGVALHEETHEELVVYRALYGKKQLWARPLKVFVGNVIMDGIKMLRFRHIGNKTKQARKKNKKKRNRS